MSFVISLVAFPSCITNLYPTTLASSFIGLDATLATSESTVATVPSVFANCFNSDEASCSCGNPVY